MKRGNKSSAGGIAVLHDEWKSAATAAAAAAAIGTEPLGGCDGVECGAAASLQE